MAPARVKSVVRRRTWIAAPVAVVAAITVGGLALPDRALAPASRQRALVAAANARSSTPSAERAAASVREMPASRAEQRVALTARAIREARAERARQAAAERARRAARARVAQRRAAEHRAAQRRSAARARRLAEQTPPPAVGSRYLTHALNVWTGPGERYTLDTVLPTGTRVAITGRVRGDWAEIVHEHRSRWVRVAYLSESKPRPERHRRSSRASSGHTSTATGGISAAPCRLGSAVESGLTPDGIRVYRAVCARYPSITSYGGYRAGDPEHGSGRALDIMVPNSAVGNSLASFLRASAGPLGVSQVLWAQRIWTVQRNSEGWRLFPDRGSVTANHYDHVHATVYGNAGS